MMNILIFLLVLTQGALAQEYTAKSGDFITVTVWERQALSGTVVVDTHGNITLPMPVGSVSVVGLTAAQISDLLTGRLEEYMVNPTVFVSISPAQGFTVHVLGEVRSPNFVKVPENTTVQEAITRAGGFTRLADKRRIQLIRMKKNTDTQIGKIPHTPRRNEAIELTLDFEQFVENTDRSANPTLKSDDVLIIPRLPKSERIRYVNVIGAVAAPGTFDLEEPLPLIEALALAGGPSDIAVLEDISILNVSHGNHSWKHVNFESFLTGEDATANPDVSPGNTVFVPREERRPFSVNVVGQIAKPGAYSVTDEARLLDAIYQAGGFVDEAVIDRVTIIHGENPPYPLKNRHSQSSIEERVNVREYLISGEEKYNPLLTEGDTIFVPMSEDARKIPAIHTAFFSTIRVSIIGEVAKPDIYQVSAEASVLDILKIAGGPTSEADLERVTVIREILEAKEEQKRQTIDLQEVLTEGEFQLLPKLKADDTIFIPRLKPKRNIWGTVVRIAADISTVTLAYLIVTGRRY
jgi:protein involved in polysaccharide export with SLBB domain